MHPVTTDEQRESSLRHELGQAITQARKRANLTQAQLAAKVAARLGVDALPPSAISWYETGRRAPTLGVLDAIVEEIGAGEGALVAALRRALTPHRR